MSKKRVKGKDKPIRDIANPWEEAIYDAECLIVGLKTKIQRLRGAIVTFRDMRDSGEPWPGESESGLIGQAENILGKSDLLGKAAKLNTSYTAVYLLTTPHRLNELAKTLAIK